MGFFFAFADDMDINDCPLMGAHGYCSQEMVHLFLLGKAISNTFDGDKILDEANKAYFKQLATPTTNTEKFLKR